MSIDEQKSAYITMINNTLNSISFTTMKKWYKHLTGSDYIYGDK